MCEVTKSTRYSFHYSMKTALTVTNNTLRCNCVTSRRTQKTLETVETLLNKFISSFRLQHTSPSVIAFLTSKRTVGASPHVAGLTKSRLACGRRAPTINLHLPDKQQQRRRRRRRHCVSSGSQRGRHDTNHNRLEVR